jgi:hypothetical protein
MQNVYNDLKVCFKNGIFRIKEPIVFPFTILPSLKLKYFLVILAVTLLQLFFSKTGLT